MNTAILHLILAFLTAIGALVTYIFWRKNAFQNQNIKMFFIFFVLFTGYHLFLSLPFFFTPDNLTAMAWGYIFAIVFLFLMCVPMWKLILRILSVSDKTIKSIIRGFLLICMIITLIQIYDFRLPIIHQSGFIIWNVNLFSAWFTSIAVGILPFLFGFSFFKNWPKNVTTVEKLKAFFFSIGGFTYGLACVYFIAWNVDMIISAFILVTLGTILFIMPFLIPKRKQIEMQ